MARYASALGHAGADAKLALDDACVFEKWEEAKMIIKKHPLLMCVFGHDSPPAVWVASYGNLDMMQFMADTILSFHIRQQCPQQQQEKRDNQFRQMFRDTFAGSGSYGYTPVLACSHANYLDCLVFLMEHVFDNPRTESIQADQATMLEKGDRNGTTSAHWFATFGNVDALDFIVRHASFANSPDELRPLEKQNRFGSSPTNWADTTLNHNVKSFIEKKRSLHVSPSVSFSSRLFPFSALLP